MDNQRFKNELRSSQDDPDFDLDSYIDERSSASNSEINEQEYAEPASSTKRNLLAIFFFVVIPALFFLYTFGPPIFRSDNGTGNTTFTQGQNIAQAPLPPAAPLPPRVSNSDGVSGVYLDYLQAANEAGYTTQINPTGIRALY
ncbi:MAG TPA: hypothetical protein DF712_06370, partial [Balneola sp.]|nr:hypothetical protein [Balneola sp.]